MHNPKLQRFESQTENGSLAYVSYTHEAGNVVLDHTFVPVELRGRGLAGQLVREALEEARRLGWQVIPRCSYVEVFIERNPEFADLVARENPE